MKKRLELQVLTPRRLLSRKEAQEALDIVCNIYPDVTPEKYGWVEPLREQFDPSNLDPILQNWWFDLFWKRKRPRVTGSIGPSWGRLHRHGKIDVIIDASKADILKLIQLLQEASSRLGADFGFIHLLTESEIAISRANKTLFGIDPHFMLVTGHNLEKNIPNLYWATIFGSTYIRHFGRDRLLSAPAYVVKELPGDCIYLQLSENIFDLETDYEKVDEVRRKVKEHLNNNSFFDPNLPTDHIYNVPEFKLIPEELPNREETKPTLPVEPEVTEDADLLAQVQDMCGEAIILAKKQFSIDLDFSEQSIELVERLLDKFYKDSQDYLSTPDAKIELTNDYRNIISNYIGAYIGEALRRKIGGIWYWENKIAAPERLLALRIGSETIFPQNKVHKRLINGPEDDVNFYFQAIKNKLNTSKGV